MRDGHWSWLSLLDLMAAVLLVGLLFLILVPAVQSPGGYGPRTQCANNMRQLGLALLMFSTSHNRFPNAGTFVDEPHVHQGDPAQSNIYRSIIDPDTLPLGPETWRSNWVVEIMPYLDQPEIANAWDRESPYWWPFETIPGQPSNQTMSRFSLGVLKCPDDTTAQPEQGNLSYVVNGGFARWYPIPVSWTGDPKDGQSRNGDPLRWSAKGSMWESQALGRKLGVFSPGTHTGDQPWDAPATPSSISDGASNTLMVGENILVGWSRGSPYAGGFETNWACPLPNFTMFLASDDVCRSSDSPVDCVGGQLRPTSTGADGPGWSLANSGRTYEGVNSGLSFQTEGSSPYINSGHPGGANFVFCDGATRFITSSIDGTVYAKLITPGGERLPDAIKQRALDRDPFAQ